MKQLHVSQVCHRRAGLLGRSIRVLVHPPLLNLIAQFSSYYSLIFFTQLTTAATTMAPCSANLATPKSPSSALFFTKNITRRAIAWDPARQRPTQEMIHGVHAALHYALDPCIDHSDEVCSFELVREDEVGGSGGKGKGSGNDEDGLKEVREGVWKLVIPKLEDMQRGGVRVDNGDVTAKLFFGREGPKERYVDDALDVLERVTGSKRADRFLVSLKGVNWAGGEEGMEDGMGEVRALGDVWQHISALSSLERIGVSDFSPTHLKQLLSDLNDYGTTKGSGAGNEEGERETSSTTTGRVRKPSMDQLNFETPPPRSLVELAKTEVIELLTHSDDLGSTRQLVGLLNEFEDRLPLPPQFLKNRERAEEALCVQWVLKYTVLIKDRGLVADKGYVVAASFPLDGIAAGESG